jgi:hypothetical protein
MDNRKIAALQYGGSTYGHIEEGPEGDLVINIAATPVGWNGLMSIKVLDKPRDAKTKALFSLDEQ